MSTKEGIWGSTFTAVILDDDVISHCVVTPTSIAMSTMHNFKHLSTQGRSKSSINIISASILHQVPMYVLHKMSIVCQWFNSCANIRLQSSNFALLSQDYQTFYSYQYLSSSVFWFLIQRCIGSSVQVFVWWSVSSSKGRTIKHIIYTHTHTHTLKRSKEIRVQCHT